jgi:hypothetical protein
MNLILETGVSYPCDVDEELLTEIVTNFLETFISQFSEALAKVDWDGVDEVVLNFQAGTRSIDQDAASFLEESRTDSK